MNALLLFDMSAIFVHLLEHTHTTNQNICIYILKQFSQSSTETCRRYFFYQFTMINLTFNLICHAPKMLQRLSTQVCEIERILRVLETYDKAFMVNQYLKGNSSNATTRHFSRTYILYLKIAGPIIFKMQPWEPMQLLKVLIYGNYRTGMFFGGFLEFRNTLAIMTRRRLQNWSKITLQSIGHSSAPINATQVPKVPL